MNTLTFAVTILSTTAVADPEGRQWGPWTTLLKFAFCRFVSVSFSFSHHHWYTEMQALAQSNDCSMKTKPKLLTEVTVYCYLIAVTSD